MPSASLACPYCDSTDTKYNAIKQYWRCLKDDCDETFEGEPPKAIAKETKPWKVFISYGHDDNTLLVKALKEQIESAGHKVWIDYEQIDKAQDWRQQIARGINDSERVLSFLSKHSVRDPGVCLDEIGIAISDRHGAIATLLVEPEKEVRAPASVSHIQYCNLSNWKEMRARGDAIWEAWLNEQSRVILDIIARETGFAGEMDSLRQKLNPLAQHQLLGSLVKQTFVGRTWVFEALEKWRTGQLNQRLFLISGGPGMGKSMISAQLAHYSKLHAVAYHFCRWDGEESRNPHAFVCNLAYQLAARNANYRSSLIIKVNELISRKPLLEWTPNDLFTQLINEAGAGAIDGGQSGDRMLVVIDALDEAPEIARLLTTRFSKIDDQPPAWIGIVATTRPEQQIPEDFSTYACRFPLLGNDQNNLADLTAYIDEWSTQLPTPLSSGVKAALIARSEGSIYYLVLAREGCASGNLNLSNPDDLPQGLAGWYSKWFDRQFDHHPNAWARAKPLLRVLCATPEPLPLTVATNVLGWRNEDDEEVLSPFGALIRWDNQQIQFAHRSFAEWLSSTTGTYRISSTEGRIKLAKYFWGRLPQLMKASTPEFGHAVLPLLLLETRPERRGEIWGESEEIHNQLAALASCLKEFHTLKIRQATRILNGLTVHVCEGMFGVEHPNTLTAKGNLALTLYDQGDLVGARIQQENVLSSMERILGTEHPDTLTAMGSLALTLFSQWNLAGARVLQEKVLLAQERIKGAEHPYTLTGMGNLASTLHAQGDLAGARAQQEKVLSARERVLGVEHPETLIAMVNLASTLHTQGDLAEARVLQEKALLAEERIKGDEHPDTLITMNNLAVTLQAQGDLAGARAQQEKVLSARERIFGVEHPETLRAMGNLALTLHYQGDLVGARVQQEKVLSARERILGVEHPDTLIAMGNLALTLHNQGDLVGARAQKEKVLSARERVLGAEHPNTLIAMNQLAVTLQSQGDFAGAKVQREKVLSARERVLGAEHPNTLIAMNNLAVTLEAQGDLAGARSLQEKILSARERIQGAESPDTLIAMNNLAATLQAQGELAGARLLLEKALSAQARILGAEHPDTLIAMNNLAVTLKAQGDLAGARAQQERMLSIMERTLGAEHPDALTAMGNLASMLYAQGDLAGARAQQEKVLSARARILGAEHPDTLTAMNNLAATLQAQGELRPDV